MIPRHVGLIGVNETANQVEREADQRLNSCRSLASKSCSAGPGRNCFASVHSAVAVSGAGNFTLDGGSGRDSFWDIDG